MDRDLLLSTRDQLRDALKQEPDNDDIRLAYEQIEELVQTSFWDQYDTEYVEQAYEDGKDDVRDICEFCGKKK